MNELSLSLPSEVLEQLAARVADILEARGAATAASPEPDPWLDVDAAAAYLSCKPKRVYDLRSQGRLEYRKDGSRLLFKRSWLDDYLERT